MLHIGLSACFFHPDPSRNIFKGKRLLYMEEQMVQFVQSYGALVILIPQPQDGLSLSSIVGQLDGLVLQGGSDIAPQSYGEPAMEQQWPGDYMRDQYEISLIQEFFRQQKPVFGICRGAQILNVAMGGSMIQDIPSQLQSSYNHRDAAVYDQNFHPIRIEKNSFIEKLYPKLNSSLKVNSVHHQCIKTLGKNLVVEAFSDEKVPIVEAYRVEAQELPFGYGVQWHPEFMKQEDDEFFVGRKIFDHFIAETKKRKN